MKLNREKLIELVSKAITACDDRQVEWDRNVAAAEADWERRWKQSHLPKWRSFRDKLTKALKDGSHITIEDIPLSLPSYRSDPIEGPLYRPFNRGRYKYNYGSSKKPENWYADHRFGPRPVTEKEQFEVVLVFLQMVEEEIITTGQLQQAGFRNLEKLVSAASSSADWTEKAIAR